MRIHRSVSGLGVQNGWQWIWICLPFSHLNPCFCLLHVVEMKKSFHSLFIRLFTETDSTIEEVHYWTMSVKIHVSWFYNVVCELWIFFLYKEMLVYLQEPHAKRRTCSQTLLSGNVRSSDCKVRIWLPGKLENATQWQIFAVRISHYFKLNMKFSISNCGLKITFINDCLRMDFLSIRFCKQTNKQRMTTFFT